MKNKTKKITVLLALLLVGLVNLYAGDKTGKIIDIVRHDDDSAEMYIDTIDDGIDQEDTYLELPNVRVFDNQREINRKARIGSAINFSDNVGYFDRFDGLFHITPNLVWAIDSKDILANNIQWQLQH